MSDLHIACILIGLFFAGSVFGWTVLYGVTRERDHLKRVVGHYFRELQKANRIIPQQNAQIMALQIALSEREDSDSGESWKHSDN